MNPPVLYVIRAPSGARKIGQSIHAPMRLTQLKTYNAIKEYGDLVIEYELPCPPNYLTAGERHAHALVWDHRIKGEWFTIDAEQARSAVDAAVAAAQAGGPFIKPKRKRETMKRSSLAIPISLYQLAEDYRFESRHRNMNDALLDLIETGLAAVKSA